MEYHQFADDKYTHPSILMYTMTWNALLRDSVTASMRSHAGWFSINSRNLVVRGTTIKPVVFVKNLGAHFNIHMNMRHHVYAV